MVVGIDTVEERGKKQLVGAMKAKTRKERAYLGREVARWREREEG